MSVPVRAQTQLPTGLLDSSVRPARLSPWRDAQRLAFGPILFHAVAVARDKGLLREVERASDAGLTVAQACAALKLSEYAATVLLDGCVAAGAMEEQAGTYRLTRVGWLVQNDAMTRVNMDFSRDVCDRAMGHLAEALDTRSAAGLKELVPEGKTVYEVLSKLQPQARASWLAFDHYYSDQVFPIALRELLSRKPTRVLDVGGNTGKFAALAGQQVPVTVVDHPAQIRDALATAKEKGVEKNVSGVGMDLLDHSQPLPKGYDAVWMSQFLCCFGPEDIVQLLARGKAALAPDGRVYVNETFIDCQPNDVAKDSLMATSLYFTTVANGNSRMYRAGDFANYVREAGLEIESTVALGAHHTLLTLRPR